MKEIFMRVKLWISGLSFKTGLFVLGACILCYVISFAQMALPISLSWKGGLWVAFFGLAKALQYTGLLILGKEGVKKLRDKFRKKEMA